MGKTGNSQEELLKSALAAIEKEYGKGSIMTLGSRERVSIDVISSGSLALDRALGIGGYPKGRVIEIFGPESSGKTTTALHAVAECQKSGGVCAYIDVEHAIDPVYAEALGVDVDTLLLSQPDSGEQALGIAQRLVQSGAVQLVVIDSVAALVPQAELDGEMGDSHVGLQARLMSQALRKLTGMMSSTGTTVIFINQLREKVGMVFGNPETTPGGRALKFYASVRVDVRRGEPLKDGAEFIGNATKLKIVKNKVAPPFKTAVVNIVYGRGFSHADEVITMGVEYGIVEKSGSWYSYNGEKIGQGMNAARKFMEANPDIDEEITEKIKAAMFAAETNEGNLERIGIDSVIEAFIDELSFNGMTEESQEKRRNELDESIRNTNEILKLPREEQEKHFHPVENLFKELGIVDERTEEGKEESIRQIYVDSAKTNARWLREFLLVAKEYR